jgi:steroid 5-alpha reductase family enzyme
MEWKKNRIVSLLIILLVYLAAGFLAVLVFRLNHSPSLLWRIFLADISATFFVYLAGLPLQNASVYDPYWSVAPVFLLAMLAGHVQSITTGEILLLVAVGFWGVRLTANWLVTFRNLLHQDWRYDYYKKTYPVWYPLISLFGIHLFPTLVVFAALVPAILYLKDGRSNILTAAGFAVCLIATALELFADAQLHAFQRENQDRSRVIRSGLWRICRHPNYLGEILMWWGVSLFLISVRPDLWWTGTGALVNTLMFLFISVPLAEKRMLAYKPAFEEYARAVPMLLPLGQKRSEKAD